MDVARRFFVEEGYGLSESFKKIVDIVEHDYKRGFLKYKLYWRLKKFYEGLVEKARSFEKEYFLSKNKEKLLLKFLNAIVSMNSPPEKKLTAFTVASLIKVDVDTANEFIRWLKNSDYDALAKFVIRSKRRETALKQHSGLER